MFAGRLWGVQGLHVDREGNLYVAERTVGACRNSDPSAARILPIWSQNRSLPSGSSRWRGRELTSQGAARAATCLKPSLPDN